MPYEVHREPIYPPTPKDPVSREWWVATIYICEHCHEPVKKYWTDEIPDVQAWLETKAEKVREWHLTLCEALTTCGVCGTPRELVPNIIRAPNTSPGPGYSSCRCVVDKREAEVIRKEKQRLREHLDPTITVIDWTYWGDSNYEEVPEDAWYAHEAALVDHVRKINLRRGGFFHQHSGEGVPVFSTGYRMEVSMRRWGRYLAWAHEPDSEDPMNYCYYAWYTKEEKDRQEGDDESNDPNNC